MSAVLDVMQRHRVEKLVDILVACAVQAGMSEHFTPLTRSDDIGDWVREQLNACGFECSTIGSSHCVLAGSNFMEALIHGKAAHGR